jgi:rhodanese-related sulfurtransferase
MGTWAFNAKHIPGSFNISTPEEATKLLMPNDEIIVYCSNAPCVASQTAFQMLTKAGFTRVRRFSGGLDEWERAGYPLEGDMVE